jgi:hypothetical protein
MKKSLFTITYVLGTAIGSIAVGQTTTSYEDGADGVRYQVTRQVVQRSIPQTEIQTRQQTVYRPQITTEYQSYSQTYIRPVTQYQYVPHLRNWWNPLGQAYWTHDLQPVTTWVAQPATVQVPVARTNWVPEVQTTQVPVTTFKTVSDEHFHKQAVGVTAVASSTTVATQPVTVGGQQYQSDLPRTASPWAGTTTRR